MKNKPETKRPTIQGLAVLPQQIYLRRAAHSAATYLGYLCHIAFEPEPEALEVLCEGELPPAAARHSYLRTAFHQPAGMARQAPDLHPRVLIEWNGATPTILEGAGSSLATYVEGLAREILARMGPKAEEASHDQ